MVRLVFRPYTQVWRSICTSEPLRTSTRVSSGFALLRHSSPSFGSQRMHSISALPTCGRDGTVLRPDTLGNLGSYLSCPKQPLLLLRFWVFHPLARAYVRLLGPCFKTGRMGGRHWHRWRLYVETSPITFKSNRIDRHLRASTNTIDQLAVTRASFTADIYFT